MTTIAMRRVLENLAGRVGGPLNLRLVIQPLMASLLAFRFGLADVRAGRAPYSWASIVDPAGRRQFVRETWRSVGRVFLVAVAIDVIYQLVVTQWVYPGEALIVGAVLAFVPHLAVRAAVTRIARRRWALKG